MEIPGPEIVTAEDIVFIREFIADASRQRAGGRLSAKLCEAWQWKQANGALRDMVCRGLLLMLHRAGEIELPAVRQTSRIRLARRERPQPMLIDTTPLSGVAAVNSARSSSQQVRRTADEPLFNSLMEQHHYLGYEQPVGEHLKYLVWAQGRPIACLAWSSAPRHLGSRDRYIGWSAEARRRNIRFIAYNTRFLILPWVRVPHLASHILGRVTRALSDDWERMYGHPVYFAETFIDPGRFRGTCYRAANWQLLGLTTGRGKDDQHQQAEPLDQRDAGLALDARVSASCSASDDDETRRRRCEPGRTGPDHRSRHAGAAERSGRPEAQNRAACHGGETGAEAEHGENQRRSAAGCGARRQAGDRRIGSGRSRAQWRRCVYRRERVAVAHATLHAGDRCPECREGKVYRQKEPATLIRIVGQAPLEATVFEMERLRCNACGEVFTADEPETAGADKYDATAVAMIALLKYGTGVPFNRLERLEEQLGMPLPAATQWELMAAAAKLIRPVLEELIRQAAQGSVMHNDDTSMRILRLAREPGDERTGTFTSGIVSMVGAWTIALFFTGWKHAGENLADVLKQRARELPAPIQMCDALSRNTPKLEGVETLLANCLAHGRRQVVEVVENFPEECRYVLETLGDVYHYDALAREQELSPEERLRFHQEHSGPVMEELHEWMEAQLAEHKTEPNSGLGKAISYLLNHWTKLTLFLRQAGRAARQQHRRAGPEESHPASQERALL